MAKGLISKFKDWISDESEYTEEIEVGEFVEEDEDEIDIKPMLQEPKVSKIRDITDFSKMKVVITEPENYEDATEIANNLKQKKVVIVNLEKIDDSTLMKKIFAFMHGVVYVLSANMQKVAKSIYILTPENVNIDSNMKKELEVNKKGNYYECYTNIFI